MNLRIDALDIKVEDVIQFGLEDGDSLYRGEVVKIDGNKITIEHKGLQATYEVETMVDIDHIYNSEKVENDGYKGLWERDYYQSR